MSGFKDYNLSKEITDALDTLGYKEPTEIQKKVIPLALEGMDIVGKSQTGSGKSAAFAIPICEKCDWLLNTPQAIVIEPARELAIQVREEIFNIGRNKRIKVPVAFGGVSLDRQVLALKQKSHILAGTPGRICDLMDRGAIKTEAVKYVVIDEADLLFDMGFIDDVKRILDNIEHRNFHIMLFSATMDERVVELIEDICHEPVMAYIENDTETVKLIDEKAVFTESENKIKVLMDLITVFNPGECIIFTGTKDMANVIMRHLKKERIRAGVLHGDIDQRERINTVFDFKKGKLNFLVATDVAARGIDFENITHVINFDFPTSKEIYVHRIGRTARNGKSGTAVSILTRDEEYLFDRVVQYTKSEIEIIEPFTEEEVKAAKEAFLKNINKKVRLKRDKGEALNDGITKISIGGGKKSKIRTGDIVATLCSIDGIEADDIGVIDIRESQCYVDILNNKGEIAVDGLAKRTLKGKVRKVQVKKNSVKMYF